MSNDKDDDKNIIHFPELEKRGAIKKKVAKDKKLADKLVNKEVEKQRKSQETIESQYRAQYRAEQAKKQTTTARRSASGKVPFINWHKIPIFTRITMGTFLIVQIILSFALTSADSAAALYYFGFVPAMYTGAELWSWSALISPFTTLILHGGWMHLIFNMVMMMIMGIFFENQYGAKRTAIFFIICGMAGNLAYLLISPTSPVPVVGASGAISGIFAVTFMTMINGGLMGPEAQKRGPLPFILLWSTIIIAMGLISHDTSWQSHIGGFWGGIALFHLWKKDKVRF